jgi:putative permease
MLIVGGVCYGTFAAFELDFAALLAALAGASVLIPYFGAPLVGIPVALTAFAQWGFGPDFIWAVGAYALIQTIDGAILGTLLLAGTVNLHPIAVMVAVLVFGDLFGFWGVFFAVPMASVVQAVLDGWRRRSQRR